MTRFWLQEEPLAIILTTWHKKGGINVLDVDNTLYVSGPTKDVQRFAKATQSMPWEVIHGNWAAWATESIKPQFCFHALVPMPKEIYDHLNEADEDAETMSKGQAWMMKNWGTYPDAQYVQTDIYWGEETSTFQAFFDTLRAPDNWLITVAKQFPMLDFRLECIDLINQVQYLVMCCKGSLVEYLPCEADEDY